MLLFIDACCRGDSRTRRLAKKLLATLDGGVKELKLYEKGLVPLDEGELALREELIAKADFSHEMFDLAKELAAADEIVVAAPYWDLSFPSILKVYIERVSVRGITFGFDESGAPFGLLKAKKLWYVTTMGAAGLPYDFGYGYVKAIFSIYYGVKDFGLVTLEALDLAGNDPEKMLAEAVVVEGTI